MLLHARNVSIVGLLKPGRTSLVVLRRFVATPSDFFLAGWLRNTGEYFSLIVLTLRDERRRLSYARASALKWNDSRAGYKIKALFPNGDR